jgi:hypothetical protein
LTVWCRCTWRVCISTVCDQVRPCLCWLLLCICIYVFVYSNACASLSLSVCVCWRTCLEAVVHVRVVIHGREERVARLRRNHLMAPRYNFLMHEPRARFGRHLHPQAQTSIIESIQTPRGTKTALSSATPTDEKTRHAQRHTLYQGPVGQAGSVFGVGGADGECATRHEQRARLVVLYPTALSPTHAPLS